MRKKQFLKLKNSLLGIEKLKDRSLKIRELKIKREIEELFFKPIIVSKDDMNRFGKKEMKKIRPIKNTCYESLINYIPEHIRKSVNGFKDKIVNLRERKETKQTKYTKH